MVPGFISTDDWNMITTSSAGLFLFAGLAVGGVLVFVATYVVLPALIPANQPLRRSKIFRPILYVFSVISLAIALFSGIQALLLAISVISRLYPRWWV